MVKDPRYPTGWDAKGTPEDWDKIYDFYKKYDKEGRPARIRAQMLRADEIDYAALPWYLPCPEVCPDLLWCVIWTCGCGAWWSYTFLVITVQLGKLKIIPGKTPGWPAIPDEDKD